MAYLLKKEDLVPYLRLLLKSYDVAGPTVSGDRTVFSIITDPAMISLERNSYYPPKAHFLPPVEEILSYRRKRSLLRTRREAAQPILESRKKVIFGMRSCDVAAAAYMDKFYSDDPNYAARRDGIFVIALKCGKEENDNCFCSSFQFPDEGYDLYFERTEEGFIVDVKTEKGKSLVDKKLFKSSVREVAKGVPECRAKLAGKRVPENLQVYSDACISCTACNSVCPSCTCFRMSDEPTIDLSAGKRHRSWDYCQAVDFSPRDKLARFRHRLLCKFAYNGSCTGCGRCVTVCPTGVCAISKMVGE
jgi:sulfhydrogenase subunit beta (sulfur reductase)